MSYGELKIDTITFTAGGVDASVSVSGLVQNPTFTGNITTTGTISGDVIRGNTVSGATVTGDAGEFGTITGNTAGFTTVTGTTVTGTTANFVTVSGTTVTGTTARFTSGVFTNISGGTHTITSGVFASGTAANPSITFVDDLDTGLFTGTANTVSIVASGAAVLTVSGANVGVGTTSPSSVLHVANSQASVGGAFIDARNTGTGPGLLISANTRDSADNAIAVLRAIDRTGTDALTVNVAGNVGIGTSEPSSLLEVRDDAIPRLSIRNVTTTSFSQLLFSEVGDGSNFVINRLGSTSTATGGARAAQIWQEADAPIVFATDNAEKIRIDGDGKLLIGTSTTNNHIREDQKFAIVSTGAVFGGASITTYAGTTLSDLGSFIDLNRSRGSTDGSMTAVADNDALGWIVFQGSDGTDFRRAAWIKGEVDGTPAANDMPGALILSTTASGSSLPTERMRIDSTGNVGIGTTPSGNLSLGYALRLNGGSQTYIAINNSTHTTQTTGGFVIGNDNVAARITQRENQPLIFDTNNTERMRILAGGGLTFNGDTAAANALDDYEEGTWTPTLAGTSTNPTYTVDVNRSQYTKIGRLVDCTIDISVTSLSGGSGQVYVTLPFTVQNSNPKPYAELIAGRNNTWFTGANNTLFGWAVENSVDGYLVFQSGNNGAETNVGWVSHTNTGSVRFCLHYLYYSNT
jgi:hypothetical protein